MKPSQLTRLLVVVVTVLLVTSSLAVGGAVAQEDGPPAPPHGIYGDVVNATGDPVEGVTVEITDESGAVIANDTTNENGSYSVKVGRLDESDEFTVSVTGVENSTEKTLTWKSGASDRVDLAVEISSGGDDGGGVIIQPSPPDDGDSPDNPQPTAAIAIDPAPATVGEEITFSAAKSTDEERDIIAYEWEIAGESYTGKTITTSFDEAGTYDVELNVSNDLGESDTATDSVTVEEKEDPPSDGSDGSGDGSDGTGDDTDGTGDDSDGTGEDADSGSSSIPGFGVTVALIALLSFAMLSLRRQS